MYRNTFVTDLFNGPTDRIESNKILAIMLNALVQIDTEYLKANPNTPEIYKSGVYYAREPLGQDDWNDIPTCIKRGACDCEDLACWRVAELNVRYGIRAFPIFSFRNIPNAVVYHIRVMYPDGRIEDPSKILGM